MNMAGKMMVIAALAGSLSGCMIEHIDDGEPRAYRVMKVPARDVAVFDTAASVPGRYTVIEEVSFKDDGDLSPDEMERNLREMAGATGANAVIMAPTNRKPNGTRSYAGLYLDNPLDYFGGTAIWVGEGRPPVKVLKP